MIIICNHKWIFDNEVALTWILATVIKTWVLFYIPLTIYIYIYIYIHVCIYINKCLFSFSNQRFIYFTKHILLRFLSFAYTHTHTHTHTRIYIYVYICIYSSWNDTKKSDKVKNALKAILIFLGFFLPKRFSYHLNSFSSFLSCSF